VFGHEDFHWTTCASVVTTGGSSSTSSVHLEAEHIVR